MANIKLACLSFMIFHVCMSMVSIIRERGYTIEIGNVQLNCVLTDL